MLERVTSQGETITEEEFQKRRSDCAYCAYCGAPIHPVESRDRCGLCSGTYTIEYQETVKKLDKKSFTPWGGLPGGE